MISNPIVRLLRVGRSVFRRPRHFFRMCEQEARNLDWIQRFAALAPIPEVALTDLIEFDETSLATITFRAGGSSVPDYVLLAGLCRRYPACHYLEVGTFLGESIANVAPFCAQCVSLSLNDEEFAATQDLAAQAREVSRMFSRRLANVRHLYADSTTYDFGQIGERFDVVFVDGCHDYSAVVSDTRNAIKLLRNDDSIIVFHDVKDTYNEIEPEVAVGIRDGLPVDWQDHVYTVANTLCAVATKRPLHSFDRISLRENPYSKPSLNFGLTVRMEQIDQ